MFEEAQRPLPLVTTLTCTDCSVAGNDGALQLAILRRKAQRLSFGNGLKTYYTFL